MYLAHRGRRMEKPPLIRDVHRPIFTSRSYITFGKFYPAKVRFRPIGYIYAEVGATADCVQDYTVSIYYHLEESLQPLSQAPLIIHIASEVYLIQPQPATSLNSHPSATIVWRLPVTLSSPETDITITAMPPGASRLDVLVSSILLPVSTCIEKTTPETSRCQFDVSDST